MRRMVVLGIDPGSCRCGFGVVGRSGSKLSVMASGVFVPGRIPMAERLAAILQGLSALLARGGVDAVAVETAFCGLSPRSALALGQARGVALAAAAGAGLPVFEYAPAEVKRAFTGSGRAEKAQMIRTARSIFGLEVRLADEADAIAIAVCHLARGRARAAGREGAPRKLSTGQLRPSVRRFVKVA